MNDPVDVLLIQPPIRDFYLTSKRTIPHGLACIASSLMAEGFSVAILDALATPRSRVIEMPEEMAWLSPYYGRPDISPFALFHRFRHYGHSFERIGRMARESGAFLVGISSLFTAYGDEALRTAEAVRTAHPTAKIVLGGHHPTAFPEDVLGCDAVDFVIRGEGEAAMPRLAKAVRRGEGFETVPGIAMRLAEGGIRVNDPAIKESLDDGPLPASHLLDNRFYRRAGKGSAVIVGSRGCPMGCTYCSVGRYSHIPYRRRGVEAVLGEIEDAVQNRNAGLIDFEDENISMDRAWFLELLAGIEERCAFQAPELRAMNGLFPPTLDREVVAAMKRAGFKALNLSLGSTSSAQLKRFGRPDVRASFHEAVSLARKYGLETVAYIIVGAPGQSPDDSVTDILHLLKLEVLIGVSVYYPSPGSVDFGRCRKEGILPHRFSLMRSTAIPISHTTTREESVTLMRLGRIANFMKALSDGGIRPSGHHDRRMEAGRHLLRLFMEDAVIRGMTPDDEIYAHKTSGALSARFIEGLSS